METLNLNNKTYVVVEKDQYNKLLEKAASKSSGARKMTLSEGKAHAHNLIDKWSKEK